MADTLLLTIVSMLRKPGNICCGHRMFQKEIRNIFCTSDTNTHFVSATNVARAGKQGEICLCPKTICPRLPPPKGCVVILT